MLAIAVPSRHPTVEHLDDILRTIALQEKLTFNNDDRRKAPQQGGIYAIYTNDEGVCLYAGRTKTQTLEDRLFRQHLSGAASRDIVSIAHREGIAADKRSARHWVRHNCVFRCLVVEDPITRVVAEYRLISFLRPIWYVPRADEEV